MIRLLKGVPRNTALLITLLVLILILPLVQLESSWIVFELLLDLILLAGVYSVGQFRWRGLFVGLTVVTASE